MNALAILYVNQHLEDIRKDAAARSLAPKLSTREHVAATVNAVKGIFSWRAELPTDILPQLQAYPFQS